MAKSQKTTVPDNKMQAEQLDLGMDLGPKGSIKSLKATEAERRDESDVFTETPLRPDFPTLTLPRRYEALEAEAKIRGLPLRPLVRPVREALADIEREIRLVRDTTMGRLYVITGVTGSGKTTFLNSLSLFIDGIKVYNAKGMALDNRGAVENALALLKRKPNETSVVVLEGREAPGALQSHELDLLLTTLNADFRSDTGRRTLFVIPTTASPLAQNISQKAAEIGGMTSRERPFFVFTGPSRTQFIPITNETISAFNESRTLLEYGVSEEMARAIGESSESVGQFMESCHHEIMSRRDLLTAKAAEVRHKRVHLWMVFCPYEEDLRRSYDIIRSLTFGDQQSVQVPRVLAGDAKEVRDWQSRSAEFAQAAAYLDLRILYLPVRTATAIFTAYAPADLLAKWKEKQLIQRETVRVRAQESLANTALGAFLQQRGFSENPSRRGKLEGRQQNIFSEAMKIAINDETVLNAMVAQCLRDWLNNPAISVASEKAIGNLLMDIAVISATDIYCLEFKWRSTLLQSSEVTRETVSRVTDFVKDLSELKHLLA